MQASVFIWLTHLCFQSTELWRLKRAAKVLHKYKAFSEIWLKLLKDFIYFKLSTYPVGTLLSKNKDRQAPAGREEHIIQSANQEGRT